MDSRATAIFILRILLILTLLKANQSLEHELKGVLPTTIKYHDETNSNSNEKRNNEKLSNVQPRGGDCGDSCVNIALNQPTSQSSEFGSGDCSPSSRAVDGSTDGDGVCKVSHTGRQYNAWWICHFGDYVNFDGVVNMYRVYDVVIWNRTDCCRNRLDNIRVEILDSNNQIVDYRDVASIDVNTSVKFGGSLGVALRIRHINKLEYISLAEVQIYSDGIPVKFTPLPTPLPTPNPTKEPTRYPTESPTFSPTASSVPSVFLTNFPTTLCFNFDDWRSIQGGRSCSWVSGIDKDDLDEVCDTFKDDSGVLASEACCACPGGGIDASPTFAPSYAQPSGTPLASNDAIENCLDIDGWMSNNETDIESKFYRGCWYYEFWDYTHPRGQKKCANSTMASLNNITVEQACCFCGGGTLGSVQFSSAPSAPPVTPDKCIDLVIDWEDSKGRSCETYRNQNLCESSGDLFDKDGYTASTACCSCGGGIGGESNFEYSLVVERSATYNFYGDERGSTQCIDFPYWTYADETKCSFYTNQEVNMNNEVLMLPSTKCRVENYESDEYSMPAQAACCGCINGGYSGSLINKRLRVGALKASDNGFSLFYTNGKHGDTTRDGIKPVIDGSIVNMTKIVAESTGLGLYVLEDQLSTLECVEKLENGTLDLCLGPVWSVDLGRVKFADALYEDDFYLLVRQDIEDLVTRMSKPVAPFTIGLWSVIACLVILLSYSILMIQKGGWSWKHDWKFLGTRFFSSFYHGARSFATGDVTNSSEHASKPEKFIAVAFVFFSLMVVTAYTANLAAFLTTRRIGQFSSVEEVLSFPSTQPLQICLNTFLETTFLKNFPGSSEHINSEYASDKEIIEYLKGNNKGCDVAVISSSSFGQAVDENNDICDELLLVDTSYMFSVNVSIAVSPLISRTEYGYDFLKKIQELVAFGVYEKQHVLYRQKIRDESLVLREGFGIGGSGGSSLDGMDVANSFCPTASTELTKFGYKDLLGPIMVCTCLLLAGLMIFFCRPPKVKFEISCPQRANFKADE